MIDLNGAPLRIDYSTALVSEEIGVTTTSTNTQSGNYSIDGPLSVPNAVVYIDLDGKELINGAAINLEVTLDHQDWSGDLPFPTETTENIRLDFTFSYLRTTPQCMSWHLA